METLKKIGCIALIAIIVFFFVFSLIMDYITRDDQQAFLATQTAEANATQNTRMNDFEEAWNACKNASESEGETRYSGAVFVVLSRQEKDDIRFARQSSPFIGWSFSPEAHVDISKDLNSSNAILCITIIDTRTMHCEFNMPVDEIDLASAELELTLVSWPNGRLITRENIDTALPRCPPSWSWTCEGMDCSTDYLGIGIHGWLHAHLATP